MSPIDPIENPEIAGLGTVTSVKRPHPPLAVRSTSETRLSYNECMIGTRLLDRYEILREIGRGGMGIVYLAQDPLLDRKVAVKIATNRTVTAALIDRFRKEARIVARMDHPAIVGVHDIGEHDGLLFFVMPLVPGKNLRAYMADRSLTFGDVIEVGIQVAEALAYSHQQNVIHRDIKPENIMVTREEPGNVRVRITDFGLARVATEAHLTDSGYMVGTLAYFSPEQIYEKDIDSRTDIYSLGTVLYECFVGEPPFMGETQEILYRIAHELPQSPRARGARISEDLDAVLMQCLEKEVWKRPENATELAESLTKCRDRLETGERMRSVQSVSQTLQLERPVVHTFTGRTKEFMDLQRRLSSALQGECQFAVVSGEAGVGKSRLLDELDTLARTRKLQTLHGRFIEEDRAIPYQGFCEVIQEYFRNRSLYVSGPSTDFSDLSPDLRALFPVLSEIAELRSTTTGEIQATSTSLLKKAEDRTFIFELLSRTLVRIAAGKPLVLLLEDLHAADVSLEALQYVVRRLGMTPTLIVGTYRSTEIGKHHPLNRLLQSFQGDKRFLSIHLEPFALPEHKMFLENVLGSSKIDSTLIQVTFEATEGNPYFTKELVRSLVDTEGISRDETGSWILSGEAGIPHDTLPQTIQQIVEKRIERLPENLREILSVASVLGKTFRYQDLEVLAEGDIDEALEALIQQGFLEEERASRGDRILFSSGVLREALYAALTRRKKRNLHRRYAEYLEKKNAGRLERVYPQLVHHFAQADISTRVVDYGLKLALHSLESFSAAEAIRAARTVLDFLEEYSNPVHEAEARTLLARAHRMVANWDAALKELAMAVQIYETQNQLSSVAVLSLLAAETAWEVRKIEESRKWLDKGLEIARVAAETDTMIRLLSLAATVANLRAEYEEANIYLEEAARLRPAKLEISDEIQRKGKLIVAMPAAINATHPVDIQIDEECEILGNVFETLLTTDEEGRLVPSLCEKWEVLDGGKRFLINLRPSVRLHDGRRLTASDVKTGFEASIKRAANLPPAFSVIKGVPEFLTGISNTLDGIQVLADLKLQIELSDALPIYPALLSDFRAAVSCVVAVEGAEALLSVGSGPFKIATLKPDHILLERNSSYWKGSVALIQALEFRAELTSSDIAAGLRSGEYDLARDLLPQDLEEILRDQRLRAGFAEALKQNTYFALLNQNSRLFRNPALREAMAGMIRTQDLVRGTLGRFARPAEGLIPPGILGHDPLRRRTPLREEQVQDLLKAAEVTLPVSLKAAVHPVFQDRYSILTSELLKSWAAGGIEVSIETPTIEAFLDRGLNNEGIDLIIGRWIADYGDPDSFTYPVFHSHLGRFRNYLSSAELDSWIEEARVENRTAAREKLYRKIESYLLDSHIFIPLFHEVDYRVASPKVQRLSLRSTYPYVNYTELRKAETTSRTLQKDRGGVIHVPLTGQLQTLDPATTFRLVDMEALPTVYETLTRETEGLQIAPWLCSSFSQGNGSKQFRFLLREGIKFHNGRMLSANDVRYTFERFLRHPHNECRWFFYPVKGSKQFMNRETDRLEGFRTLSPREFVVELDEPVSFFPTLLACPVTAIVAEGTDPSSGLKESGIGTGPFRIVRFDAGRILELEANPDYWRPQFPRCDRLIFAFGIPPADILEGFRSGRYSLVQELLPAHLDSLRHESEFAARFKEAPRLSTYYIAFNIHRSPLSDENLRRSLVQSINVESLVRKIPGRLAVPATGLIPPGLPGHEPERTRNWPLPEAQSTAGRIELTGMLNSAYQETYASLTEELLKRFQDRGFLIKIAETKSEYFSNQAQALSAADIVLTRWIADFPDSDTFISSLLHSQDGVVGRLCGTPEIDRLIQRGRTENEPEIRHSIYREIEEIIVRDTLLLPLFHEKSYCLARPEVEGFEIRLLSPTVAYERVWIKKQ